MPTVNRLGSWLVFAVALALAIWNPNPPATTRDIGLSWLLIAGLLFRVRHLEDKLP